MAILRGIFLKGTGWGTLWFEILLLVVYAGVVFLLATRKMRLKVA
jgi:hypothetical protein